MSDQRKDPVGPVIWVESHLEDDSGLDMDQLRRLAVAALPGCLEAALEGTPLMSLEEVEVALVDDRAIAAVHAQYLDDPSATDVITFDHGEILISVDTAAREALDRGHPLVRELLLYLVHGLLHLGGHDDRAPADRRRMGQLQDQLVARVGGIRDNA